MASKGTLTIRILGDEKPLGRSLDNASGIMRSWSKAAVGIFAGLGVAAGAVLVSEFVDAMERGRLQDRLAAQLNLTEPEAERAGKIAGDLYVDAYGDSLGQVHDAVGAVMSSLEDLDDGDVERLTAKALDLAATFDVEVTQGITTAGVLMRTGLARDADEAFDLIVRSMQNVPAEMRQELIPILEEYAQDFAALGIEGPDAFGLIVEAAQDGRFELDKTADALKELTIRSSDMSTATQEAFETIGLDAETMANKLVTGGDQARDAFDQIVDGLLAIEDPQTRANTAIALMGTPLEDLSVTEIPAFLERLDSMGDSLGDVEGAAEHMGDTLNDNVATKVESFKRRAGAALEELLAEHALPVAEKILDAYDEGGAGGAIDKMVELWEEAQPKITEWFEGTFLPWWDETAVPAMVEAGESLAAALFDGMIEAAKSLGPVAARRMLDSLPFGLGDILADLPLAPDYLQDDPGAGGRGGSLPGPSSDNQTTTPPPPPQFTDKGPTEFHGGGFAAAGGLADLADKERVLSPRQTEAFERLVTMLERKALSPGGSTFNVEVHTSDRDAADETVWALQKMAAVGGA